MVKRRAMGTVQDLRTGQKARLKCKPQTKGQELLDLYILSKLKERFEREQERVADGMKYVLKDMADISKEVEKVWAADKEAIETIAGKSLAEIRRGPAPGVAGRTERGGKLLVTVVMIHGDEEFTTSDLIGGEYGYRIRKVVDNFIHSVLKTEEDMVRRWQDNRLTVACKYGFTLIYDEFTRSRPEANNTLLSVLQEKMLDLPAARQSGESYLRVDPDFTAIFTSNPEEYAGTFRSQDALRDRMITIDLDHFDKETEVAIVSAKSGMDPDDAEKIVNIVRGIRKSGKTEIAPTVRAGIMIAKAVRVQGLPVSGRDKTFRAIAQDILVSESSRGERATQDKVRLLVSGLINKAFSRAGEEFAA